MIRINRKSVAYTSRRVTELAVAYRLLYLAKFRGEPSKAKRDALHASIDHARQKLHDAIDKLITAQDEHAAAIEAWRKRSRAAKRGHKRRSNVYGKDTIL